VGSNLNPGLLEYKPDDDFLLVSWVNKETSEEHSVSVFLIKIGRDVIIRIDTVSRTQLVIIIQGEHKVFP
jgi:hypothetical protein